MAEIRLIQKTERIVLNCHIVATAIPNYSQLGDWSTNLHKYTSYFVNWVHIQVQHCKKARNLQDPNAKNGGHSLLREYIFLIYDGHLIISWKIALPVFRISLLEENKSFFFQLVFSSMRRAMYSTCWNLLFLSTRKSLLVPPFLENLIWVFAIFTGYQTIRYCGHENWMFT